MGAGTGLRRTDEGQVWGRGAGWATGKQVGHAEQEDNQQRQRLN